MRTRASRRDRGLWTIPAGRSCRESCGSCAKQGGRRGEEYCLQVPVHRRSALPV